MKQRRLGKSGLTVSEICLGTMTFGNQADERTSHAILDRAYDAGVDFLDVAEVYPVPPDLRYAGRSEEIVGKWMADKPRDACVIATKVAGPGSRLVRGAGAREQDARSIATTSSAPSRAACGGCGTDYIDLYQTHWPDRGVPIEETLEALTRLVEAGKIRYAGCSNENGVRLTKSLWVSDGARAGPLRDDPEQLQPAQPPLRGRARGGLPARAGEPACRTARSPAACCQRQVPRRRASGGRALHALRRSQPAHAGDVPPLRQRAHARLHAPLQRHRAQAGLALPTLAMAWTLAHDFVGSTIIGATTPEQLTDTLAAADTPLSAEVLAACDQVTKEIRYPMG